MINVIISNNNLSCVLIIDKDIFFICNGQSFFNVTIRVILDNDLVAYVIIFVF